MEMLREEAAELQQQSQQRNKGDYNMFGSESIGVGTLRDADVVARGNDIRGEPTRRRSNMDMTKSMKASTSNEKRGNTHPNDIQSTSKHQQPQQPEQKNVRMSQSTGNLSVFGSGLGNNNNTSSKPTSSRNAGIGIGGGPLPTRKLAVRRSNGMMKSSSGAGGGTGGSDMGSNGISDVVASAHPDSTASSSSRNFDNSLVVNANATDSTTLARAPSYNPGRHPSWRLSGLPIDELESLVGGNDKVPSGESGGGSTSFIPRASQQRSSQSRPVSGVAVASASGATSSYTPMNSMNDANTSTSRTRVSLNDDFDVGSLGRRRNGDATTSVLNTGLASSIAPSAETTAAANTNTNPNSTTYTFEPFQARRPHALVDRDGDGGASAGGLMDGYGGGVIEEGNDINPTTGWADLGRLHARMENVLARQAREEFMADLAALIGGGGSRDAGGDSGSSSGRNGNVFNAGFSVGETDFGNIGEVLQRQASSISPRRSVVAGAGGAGASSRPRAVVRSPRSGGGSNAGSRPVSRGGTRVGGSTGLTSGGNGGPGNLRATATSTSSRSESSNQDLLDELLAAQLQREEEEQAAGLMAALVDEDDEADRSATEVALGLAVNGGAGTNNNGRRALDLGRGSAGGGAGGNGGSGLSERLEDLSLDDETPYQRLLTRLRTEAGTGSGGNNNADVEEENEAFSASTVSSMMNRRYPNNSRSRPADSEVTSRSTLNERLDDTTFVPDDFLTSFMSSGSSGSRVAASWEADGRNRRDGDTASGSQSQPSSSSSSAQSGIGRTRNVANARNQPTSSSLAAAPSSSSRAQPHPQPSRTGPMRSSSIALAETLLSLLESDVDPVELGLDPDTLAALQAVLESQDSSGSAGGFAGGFGDEDELVRGATYESLLELSEMIGPASGAGASPQEISMIPVRKVSKEDVDNNGGSGGSGSGSGEVDGKFVCAICMDEFVVGEDVMVMPACGHWFHAVECGPKWFERSKRCPTCRLDFTEGFYE
ncbi:hypothetical protein HDU76_008362 [Blyttiomyces sp. JEL0837]|nr:hypothetical protein HDU76_008362 [Blyttiomyces sp. JEL0837]